MTGGAGFIGSHVVDALVDLGHDVVGLDSLDPAAHDGVPDGLADAVDCRCVDLNDTDAAPRRLDGVDAVCHQAARVGLGVDFADVRAYVGDNDVGDGDAAVGPARRRLRRPARAGQSSMVVYGEGRYRCAEHGPVRPGPAPARRPRRRAVRAPLPGVRRAARRRVSSTRTRPPIPATSTPPPSSTRSTSPRPSAASTTCP